MKAIIIVMGIFAALLFETAYAAAPVTVPAKYNFDKNLKEAKGITDFQIASWDTIDNQSLLVKTDANDYYLVVLDQPTKNIPFEHHADIKLNINRVASGNDQLIVNDALSSEVYSIHRIYSLRNLEQANKIKARIIKN